MSWWSKQPGQSFQAFLWRHNEYDGVSNHQPNDCLLNRLFRRRSKKHQSSTSLAFVRGIHWWQVNSPHKWPVTRKMFYLMTSSWGMGISIIKMRRSQDCLIFIMGIPIPVRWHLYIEMGPWKVYSLAIGKETIILNVWSSKVCFDQHGVYFCKKHTEMCSLKYD